MVLLERSLTWSDWNLGGPLQKDGAVHEDAPSPGDEGVDDHACFAMTSWRSLLQAWGVLLMLGKRLMCGRPPSQPRGGRRRLVALSLREGLAAEEEPRF